jgi:hypothetical protein
MVKKYHDKKCTETNHCSFEAIQVAYTECLRVGHWIEPDSVDHVSRRPHLLFLFAFRALSPHHCRSGFAEEGRGIEERKGWKKLWNGRGD